MTPTHLYATYSPMVWQAIVVTTTTIATIGCQSTLRRPAPATTIVVAAPLASSAFTLVSELEAVMNGLAPAEEVASPPKVNPPAEVRLPNASDRDEALVQLLVKATFW